jgi:dephospho-CoA kinase
VKKVLLTGISGSGQSTLIGALAARGYKAVDADTPDWCEWVAVAGEADEFGGPVAPGRDWVWREDRIQALLDADDAPVLFVSGCQTNSVKFYPQFDPIILLSAPASILAQRLATRTNNLYGKQPEELARILSLKQTVEPLLRRAAGHEINTDAPLDEIVATVLRLVE